MKDLADVFCAVIGLLERERIEYAVMGGLVVRVYGIPRPTYDVDVTVSVDEGQRERLIESIANLGLEIPEVFRTGWSDRVAGMPVIKARLYLPGGGIDVDLFISETGFQRSLLSRRKRITTGRLEVWVVSPEDLILLKLLANRPRDLVDVENVLFTMGQLDTDYLRNWANTMEIGDRLEEAFENSGHAW